MNSDLSDNQKRFFCRILFLVFCALPTCVTVYVATHQRTPGQWAQMLEAELGVETSIGIVETLRPGEYIFHDVKLFDNDSEPIFESLNAYVTLGDTNQIVFRSRIEVSRKGLSHFLGEATERLVKPSAGTKLWEVSFHDIAITSDRFEYGVGRLDVTCFNEPNGRVVELRSPSLKSDHGQFTGERGWLRIARNEVSGIYDIDFDTIHGKIPCWLARHWLPEFGKELGLNAHFVGSGKIQYAGSKTNCMLTGMFEKLQMPESPRVKSIQVSGMVLEDMRWTHGRARMALEDNQLHELHIPKYAQPAMSYQSEGIFKEPIRTASRDEFGSLWVR